jgi:hypothetical protein
VCITTITIPNAGMLKDLNQVQVTLHAFRRCLPINNEYTNTHEHVSNHCYFVFISLHFVT